MSDAVACPACGSASSQAGWGGKLCPGCLLRLALHPPADEGEADPELETDFLPARSDGPLSAGKVLGNRYGVRKLLGRGGMGEVWRAFDLKLRVDVALKALREDLVRDEKRLEMLRQEVRAAREVVSPNVCRIFDLVEVEGSELVSMEYIDGATLLQVLQEQGPLELEQARDIASQFLAGLEAIHKVGLVHRDVKPENIMITRAGRVVVMDFGLARQEDTGTGTVAGTPAYMAPEQAAGLQVDARADVYAAGVVLAEMVSPEGVTDPISRQSIWEGIRSEPVKVPDTPWAAVIRKAVAKERERRFNSAHTLIRALEDRTRRVDGAEDLHPYPGLAAFTVGDAEYFFGREAEVERLWRRLDRPHLLGVVGPSGSGKSSFINAGLIPSAANNWAVVRCTPGDAALASLRRALASEIGDDSQAMAELAAGDADATVSAYARWRSSHGHGLLIVDQFEELFTLNSADEQAGAATLLSRLALEADVFVLLSMRDDFLMGCRDHQPLAPIFEDLTALPSLSGGALRRAVVQPAAKCGYRFEDDDLVEEMLTDVGGERGALPLLAFAMARLWDKRDRDNGVLARQAYHDIGGVGGALARHAEETMERIGARRVPIVRELFRNLVTAEGTRAVREWDELLSIFVAENGPRLPGEKPPARKEKGAGRSLKGKPPARTGTTAGGGVPPPQLEAEEVLRALVDARLLTSYEIHDEDREPTRRVEIIHESLLANWPRLVRWQTQDVDAAQLRDHLRQAARTWDEQGRSDDLLWTGSAFSEFALWRERYPGGLTAIEEAFANAMTALAGRRRRRRRMAVATVLVIAAAVAVVTTTLWRRSVLQERRAEAQKLIALGQLRLEDHPTAALAHATQSLELADTQEARLLALEALWQGPTAFVVNEDPTSAVSFSPGGSWLVQLYPAKSSLAVISRDGPQRVFDHPSESGKSAVHARFGGAEDLFLSAALDDDLGRIGLWSAAEGRLLATARPFDDPDGLRAMIGLDAARTGALFAMRKGDLVSVSALQPDGRHEQVGQIRLTAPTGTESGFCAPLATREWIGLVEGNDVSVVRIGDDGLSERLRLGRHEGDVIPRCEPDPLGRFLVTVDRAGGIRLWDATGDRAPSTARYSGNVEEAWVSKSGSHFWLATSRPEGTLFEVWIWTIDGFEFRFRRKLDRIEYGETGSIDQVGHHFARMGPLPANRLWSLAAPAGAEPMMLRCGPRTREAVPAVQPGRALARPAGLEWSDPVAPGPSLSGSPSSGRHQVRRRGGFRARGTVSRQHLGREGLSAAARRAGAPSGPHSLRNGGGGIGRVGHRSLSGRWVRCGQFPSVGRGVDRKLDGGDFRRLSGGRGFAVDLQPGRKIGRNCPGVHGCGRGVWIWNAATGEEVAELNLSGGEFRGCLSFTATDAW